MCANHNYNNVEPLKGNKTLVNAIVNIAMPKPIDIGIVFLFLCS